MNERTTKYPATGQKIRGYAASFLAFAGAFMFLPCASGQNTSQLKAIASMKAANPLGAASGVEATTVSLAQPSGLAYDAAGNLYIAVANDHVIRKVDLNGIITTVVGTGEQGFGGDGGAAVSALLDSPAGIAFDGAGNLYIADSHNHRIRKVVSGVITTIAGTSGAGFSGDGGVATSAQLNLPTAVSVDSSGNVYIADTNNQRIRKLAAGTMTTIAGNGEETFSGDGGLALLAGLDTPNGIAADTVTGGKFYISDTHNQRVRQVDASGVITTVAGNGTKSFSGDGAPGATASLARPRGLAVDATGRIYIADSDNNRLRLLAGGSISTIAGNGEQTFSGDTGLATGAALDTPRTTTVSNGGQVAFADTNNDRVRNITLSGAIATSAGIAPAATESLVLSGPASTVYGSGALTANFSNGSQTATGGFTLLDGTTAVGTASLSSNIATLALGALSVGQHMLTASYVGDSSNPAIVSGVYIVGVTPLAITAAANSVSVLFGQAIPALGGSLSGVLAADAGKVAPVFATTATQGARIGVYPITVALSGAAAANYSVSLATTSGSVTIALASSKTVLMTTNAAPNFAVPITLTATVSSQTSGTPTGSVQFFNGTTALGASALSPTGVATLAVATLPLGLNSITAVYGGDTNFVASNAPALAETVTPADFTFALSTSGSLSQTVTPGASAAYPLSIISALSAFPQAVTFAVSGLPADATYTLTPASIAAGAVGNGSPVLTVQTLSTVSALTPSQRSRHSWPAIAIAALLLPFGGRRFRLISRGRGGLLLVWMLFGLAGAGLLSGCGGGGFFNRPQQTYTIVVTATSGSISHSASVTLTVQ